MVQRVAAFSVHTSPLAQPGVGDGGGMNVYVDSLTTALARAGVECDVFCRADHPDVPTIVEVQPGYRVINLEVGPRRSLSRAHWPAIIDEYSERASEFMRTEGPYDVLHAHYWLSGAIAHRLKHELDVPLITTFHTLARVKAAAGFDDDLERDAFEDGVVRCSDLIVANTHDERSELLSLYDAPTDRIEVLPPGVDHTVFHARGREAAKARLGLGERSTILFAGRIQPLKGADVAVRVLAAVRDLDAVLLLVGGPSGIDGERELQRLDRLVDELGVRNRIRFVPPQSHGALARYYRAADVCVVPSRTESFGLVALEAQSCGTPVVASAVGGLRHAVAHERSGYLVGCCDAANFVGPVRAVLSNADLRARLSAGAVEHAAGFSWSIAAAKLRRLCSDLTSRELVQCS